MARRRSQQQADRLERRDPVARPEPVGLLVKRFEIEGEEYAMFQWSTDDPSPQLSSAERAVLAKLIEGASNAEIARLRQSSVRTVANQVASLLRKLHAGSRFDLIRRYGRSGDTRSP
jgi:DNA-binding NarL/FixJ family response regulator